MNKEMMSAANFRASVTVIVLSVAISVMIKKYTKKADKRFKRSR